jgi:aldehyde dehydrogenase (NAD+)
LLAPAVEVVATTHGDARERTVETLSQEYEKMVGAMRQTFRTGRSNDLAWRRTQLKQIHTMIKECHEEMTAAICADLGGNKLRGVGDLSAAKDAEYMLDHLGSYTKERRVAGVLNRAYVRPEPKGIVLIMAPWNFPFNMCFQPLVNAIAAGNLVVIKPSELNPRCAPLIESMVKRYLDPECVKVVQGAVAESTALLAQRWDHIFYTGSGEVGRIIMTAAAKHLTPVTLELGGKSPVIVDETANMDVACGRIACAKWMNCGQICVAPDYVLVQESRVEEFVRRSKDLVQRCYGENPKDSPDWGRIVNSRHVARIRKLIDSSEGEIVCGGTGEVDEEGRYMPPTIIKKPSMASPIMQEEVFGPVLVVVPFRTLDDALAVVAAKETPLALYVYSQSNANIEKVLSAAPSGGVCVNSSLEHLLKNELPFGGKGGSGMGCYHGKFGFDEFSHRRGVLRKTTLPGMRGTFIPLPSAGSPAPDFVYNLVVKLTLGIVPRTTRKVLKWGTASLVVAGAAVGAAFLVEAATFSDSCVCFQ